MCVCVYILRELHSHSPLPFSSPSLPPPRSSSEVQKRKTDALTALLRFPPEIFVELVGVDRFKDGTSILFEALQCNEVNKQVSDLGA